MQLHLAALLAFEVEEAPLGRLERVAHRDTDIGIGEFLGMVRFVADRDLVSRHTHVDVHIIEVAGLMPPVQLLDRDAAADQMFVKPVELADALSNITLQRGRGRHVMEYDLERYIHRASSPNE